MSQENSDAGDRAGGKNPRRYAIAGQPMEAPALPGGLYLVATPIGNLGDISLRALAVLAAAEVVACEDTRISRRLTTHYGIATPLTAYHEHNAAAVRPKLLARMARGEAVALISDAGTPLISDPGYRLVRAAQDDGHLVTVLPGASAVLAALNVAGLPTDRFLFDGFLPPKQSARRTRIAELSRIPATIVLFETGPRIGDALADLAGGFGARDAAICRELTKLHEDVRRGSLAELAELYAGDAETRGEFVVVISPPPDTAPATGDELDALLRRALAQGSVKEAVSDVASATGLPRRDVYRRALELKDGGDATTR